MSELRPVVIIPMIIAIIFWVFIGLICAVEANNGINPNGYIGMIRQKFDKKHPGVNKVLTWCVFVVFSVFWVIAVHTPFVDFIKNDPQKLQGTIITSGPYPNIYAPIWLDNDEKLYVWFSKSEEVFGQKCEILYAPRSKIAIRIDPIED